MTISPGSSLRPPLRFMYPIGEVRRTHGLWSTNARQEGPRRWLISFLAKEAPCLVRRARAARVPGATEGTPAFPRKRSRTSGYLAQASRGWVSPLNADEWKKVILQGDRRRMLLENNRKQLDRVGFVDLLDGGQPLQLRKKEFSTHHSSSWYLVHLQMFRPRRNCEAII